MTTRWPNGMAVSACWVVLGAGCGIGCTSAGPSIPRLWRRGSGSSGWLNLLANRFVRASSRWFAPVTLSLQDECRANPRCPPGGADFALRWRNVANAASGKPSVSEAQLVREPGVPCGQSGACPSASLRGGRRRSPPLRRCRGCARPLDASHPDRVELAPGPRPPLPMASFLLLPGAPTAKQAPRNWTS